MLRLSSDTAIRGITPDGEVFILNRHAVFVPIKPGLTKLLHAKAFADESVIEALLSCEWTPPVNQEWHPSPLIHLAFEAPDDEETQACLQEHLRCDGVVHAPEADEVPPPGGLLL